MMLTIFIVMSILFLTLTFGLGFIAFKRTKATPQEYFSGGGTLGTIVLFGTMFATIQSAFALLGLPQSGYIDGFGMLLGLPFGCAFLGIAIAFLGPRVWKAAREFNFITVSDFLSHRFNSNTVGILYWISALIFLAPFIGLQIIGGGVTIQIATGGAVTYIQAMWIMLAIIVLYTLFGGLRAVAWNDTIQAFLMISAVVVTLILLIRTIGASSIESKLAALDSLDLLTMPGPNGVWTFKYAISYGLLCTVGGLMWPQGFTRFYMSKDVRAFKAQAVWFPIACILLLYSAVTIGVLSVTVLSHIENTDQVLPILAMQLFNPFVAAFILIGVISALMSTSSSQLLAVSAIFTRDIYKKYINPNATQANQTLVGRIAVVTFALIAGVIAMNPPSLVVWIGTFSIQGILALLPVIFCGLFWKGITKAGAIAGSFVGLFVMVGLLAEVLPSSWTFGFMPWFSSNIMGLIVIIVVSKFTTPLSNDLVHSYFSLWQRKESMRPTVHEPSVGQN